eukprot:PLAT195.1.p1 GENE.PLAT195.1~~PLAT195.1.p1  ORF type:complete len:1518 (+),score=685.68 PLAT195.1:42-4556(+)
MAELPPASAGKAGSDGPPGKLMLKHAFGLGEPIRGGVLLPSAEEVIFPVGAHVASTQLSSGEMKLLKLRRGVVRVLAMAMTANGAYIALSEQVRGGPRAGGPQSQVSVYDLRLRQCMRTLSVAGSSHFLSLHFSGDGRLLVGHSSEPEHALVLWQWESATVLASIKAGRCSRVKLAPASTLISSSGVGHLKLWTLKRADGSVQAESLAPPELGSESTNFTDHCWLDNSSLAVVSEKGHSLVFMRSDSSPFVLRAWFECDIPDARLQSVVRHSTGFISAGAHGIFQVFERTGDEKEPFTLLRSLRCGDAAIVNMAMAPHDELLAIHTAAGELRRFAVHDLDRRGEGVDFFPELLPAPHFGTVLAIDECITRPTLASVGVDATVRIWNYMTWRCQLMHSFEGQEPSALAMHPSGLQVAIGFRDRLALFNVLRDRLVLAKELPLRQTRICRFSHGGAQLAAVIGISIHVFNVYTMEQIAAFSGHVGAVHDLQWSADDLLLQSVGEDGAMFVWNTVDETQDEESKFFDGLSKFNSCATDNSGRYAVCNNKKQLFCITNGAAQYSLTADVNYTALCLSVDGRLLFAGTEIGTVRVYAWPLVHSTYHEFPLHCKPIRQLRISHCGNMLFSAGEDGVVAGTLVEPDAYGRVALDGSRFDSLVVLEDVRALDSKERRLEFLQTELTSKEEKYEFDLHTLARDGETQMEELRKSMDSRLAEEMKRYEQLQKKHDEFVKQQIEELERIDAEHVMAMQELMNKYEKKLADEVERHDRLSVRMERERLARSDEAEQAMDGLADELREARLAAADESAVLRARVAELEHTLSTTIMRHNASLRQLEEEHDTEIAALRADSSRRVEAAEEAVAVKHSQLIAGRNRREALRKRVQEGKRALQQQEAQYAALQEKHALLEETLRHMEMHISERESSLASKEKIITDLRTDNRTLDNFHYVLDNKLKELSRERGPITEYIGTLESHIRSMYDELVTEFSSKKELGRVMESKEMRMDVLERDNRVLRSKLREQGRRMDHVCHDLSKASNLTGHAAESALTDLYRVHVRGEQRARVASGELALELLNSSSDPSDILAAAQEVKRQHRLMERNLELARRQLKALRSSTASRAAATRRDNSELMTEMNDMRREKRELQRRCHLVEQEVKLLRSRARLSGGPLPSVAEDSELGMDEGRVERARTAGSGGSLRTASSTGSISDALLRSGLLRSPARTEKREDGKLIRGSTASLLETRGRSSALDSMLSELDSSKKEVQSQRMEIARLRQQIALLAQSVHAPGSTPAAAATAATAAAAGKPATRAATPDTAAPSTPIKPATPAGLPLMTPSRHAVELDMSTVPAMAGTAPPGTVAAAAAGLATPAAGDRPESVAAGRRRPRSTSLAPSRSMPTLRPVTADFGKLRGTLRRGRPSRPKTPGMSSLGMSASLSSSAGWDDEAVDPALESGLAGSRMPMLSPLRSPPAAKRMARKKPGSRGRAGRKRAAKGRSAADGSSSVVSIPVAAADS